MAKKLTNGKVDIGAYMFPDRKKPCLCIAEGSTIKVYGHFNSVKEADEFMYELGKLVGAKMESENE